MNLNVIIDCIVNIFSQMNAIDITIGSISVSLLDLEISLIVGNFILQAISRSWVHPDKDKE